MHTVCVVILFSVFEITVQIFLSRFDYKKTGLKVRSVMSNGKTHMFRFCSCFRAVSTP